MTDKSPPWVLFVDKGRPVAILPAGRPGEVADVRHLTPSEAGRIVRLANELFDACTQAKLSCIKRELVSLAEEIEAHKPVSR